MFGESEEQQTQQQQHRAQRSVPQGMVDECGDAAHAASLQRHARTVGPLTGDAIAARFIATR
jgi:alkylated DNA nucleotide flippase Atl1